ncbi:MAG: Hsp20/alpha crystallin family protein [Candidatus Bathyarchaeota archaeon]
MSEEDWWSRWFRKRKMPMFRGSLFGDMDEMLREMEEMMEKEFKQFSTKVPKDLVRERTLPDGTKVKSWGPFVYGYSVTVGPDGKPNVREFGNVKTGTQMGRPRINIQEKREPLADVMTTDGEVKVIVELPGVEKKDIKLHGTEKKLTISVDTPQRKYFKEVNLPVETDPKKAQSCYKNGVLDVTLPKKKEKKPKGELINIE